MEWKKNTRLFIISIFIMIVSYDVLTIYKGGVETSISQTLIEWSYKMPSFTFAMGFIMGHLFWRLRDNDTTKDLK